MYCKKVSQMPCTVRMCGLHWVFVVCVLYIHTASPHPDQSALTQSQPEQPPQPPDIDDNDGDSVSTFSFPLWGLVIISISLILIATVVLLGVFRKPSEQEIADEEQRSYKPIPGLISSIREEVNDEVVVDNGGTSTYTSYTSDQKF